MYQGRALKTRLHWTEMVQFTAALALLALGLSAEGCVSLLGF